MSERYYVTLAKENLVFSAAHFISYNGQVCERLHGHNYRVTAELEGPLDENHYVVDFLAMRDTLLRIVQELDHHVLLPTRHRWIKVQSGPKEVEVTFEDRRWVFPRSDCVLLPVENTTAELLARHIGRQFLAALSADSGFQPQHIRVAVDENHGQWGNWEQRAGTAGESDRPIGSLPRPPQATP